MRLIAERLLRHGCGRLLQSLKDTHGAAGTTFVDRELISQEIKPLQPSSMNYHVYCSSNNPGADSLMAELAGEHNSVPCDACGGRRRAFPWLLQPRSHGFCGCDAIRNLRAHWAALSVGRCSAAEQWPELMFPANEYPRM